MTGITLASVNAQASAHTMQVADPGRLLEDIGRSITVEQLVREMIHNSFHAVGPIGNGAIALDVTMVGGIAKLTFIDTGIGMNAADILQYIGNMSSSSRTDTDRFGCGGKLTGMNFSPLGMEYISWNGTDTPVRAILAKDGGTIAFRDLDTAGNRIVPVSVGGLHEKIRNAGHGTAVIVHGHTPDEDTYQTVLGVVAKSKLKGYSRYFNGKYATIPDGVNVYLKARRSSEASYFGTGDVDDRHSDSVGLMAVLNAVSTPEGRGTYVGNGWAAHWFHTVNAGSNRKFDNADNCWNTRLVAVSYPDREIPNLREVYDLQVSAAGAAALSLFGLGSVSDRTAIVVEITDPEVLGVAPNLERTMLIKNGKQFSISNIAREFRNNMPEYLETVVDETISNTSIDLSAEIARLISENKDLFDPRRLTSVRTSGGGIGSHQQSSADLATSDRSQNGRAKPRTRNGAPGNGAGEATTLIPKVITWNVIDDEYRKCFALWDATSNCLMVNDEFEQIDRETDWLLDNRQGSYSRLDRKAAREQVRQQMIMTALEAIVQVRLVQRHDVGFESNWDYALTPHGITAAVMPALARRQLVAKNISKKLGKATN